MIKRTVDIIFSIITLVALSPLLLWISICVWLSDLHNPIFIQQRYGQNGSKFNLIKFRTMKVIQNGEQRNIIDMISDDRVTSMGKILRASHLDELPQLINILNGNMSIVGPRPIPCDMQVTDIPNWKFRSTVRPGLTGLAQVCCTKYTTLRNKFRFDAVYVRRQRFSLDSWIVMLTAYRLRYLLLFASWTIGILLATLMPISEQAVNDIAPFANIDKLAHFMMFAGMMYLTVRLARNYAVSFGKAVMAGCMWCLFLAVFTEVAQSFIPLRNMSLWDFVADMCGVASSILMVLGDRNYAKEMAVKTG